MIFNNKTYNVLKFITLIFLPAIGAFYFAMAGMYNLPYPQQVVGTLAALAVFLGVLLEISTTNYNKQTTARGYMLSSEDVLPPSKTVTFYDVMKWVAQLLIPALATLYFTIASIWKIPSPELVVGTLTAIDALLGMLLGLSSAAYNTTGVNAIGKNKV